MFHALSAILCDSLIQNVNYLRGFQYAVAASIYFVPSNSKYYDVLTEGLYGTSRLLSLIVDTKDAYFKRETGKPGVKENITKTLTVLSRIISLFELFVEKLSVCLGRHHRSLVVTVVESLKATCRLCILYNYSSVDNVMLLSWCKNFVFDGDNNNAAVSYLKDYIGHLRKKQHGLAQLEGKIVMEMERGICTPIKNHLNISAISTSSGTSLYIGRRSGLALKSLRGNELGCRYIDSPATTSPSNSSSNDRSFDTISIVSSSSAPAMHRNLSVAEKSSVHGFEVNRNVNEYRTDIFTAEDLFMYAEVIYIVRPVVCASILSYFREVGPDVGEAVQGETQIPKGHSAKSMQAQALAYCVSLILEVLSVNMTLTAMSRIQEKVKIQNPSRSLLGGVQEVQFRKRMLSEILHYESCYPQHPIEIEVNRRKMCLLLYLIKSPVLQLVSSPCLELLSGYISRLPILSSIPRYVLNTATYLNKYHFYTSNSS